MIESSKHNQLLDEFIYLLNEEKFYDAHESIEIIWFPRRFEDNDEIKLLKGFINASVSFELVKRGRYKQSLRVWQTYLKYRPILYKISSPHIQKYHLIDKKLFNIKESLDTQNSNN